jgi:hypothetical protein
MSRTGTTRTVGSGRRPLAGAALSCLFTLAPVHTQVHMVLWPLCVPDVHPINRSRWESQQLASRDHDHRPFRRKERELKHRHRNSGLGAIRRVQLYSEGFLSTGQIELCL